MDVKRLALGLATSVLLAGAASTALAGPGDALLADAVMRSDRDATRTLLQQKADVNAAQVDGMTALHWATRQNDVETAQSLLKAGAKVNAVTRYGVTPLFIAATNGNTPLLEIFLKAG